MHMLINAMYIGPAYVYNYPFYKVYVVTRSPSCTASSTGTDAASFVPFVRTAELPVAIVTAGAANTLNTDMVAVKYIITLN